MSTRSAQTKSRSCMSPSRQPWDKRMTKETPALSPKLCLLDEEGWGRNFCIKFLQVKMAFPPNCRPKPDLAFSSSPVPSTLPKERVTNGYDRSRHMFNFPLYIVRLYGRENIAFYALKEKQPNPPRVMSYTALGSFLRNLYSVFSNVFCLFYSLTCSLNILSAYI